MILAGSNPKLGLLKMIPSHKFGVDFQLSVKWTVFYIDLQERLYQTQGQGVANKTPLTHITVGAWTGTFMVKKVM